MSCFISTEDVDKHALKFTSQMSPEKNDKAATVDLQAPRAENYAGVTELSGAKRRNFF